jgi:hypothetical protein
MRTISKSLKLRLLAQAQEADTLGLAKIAEQLEMSVYGTDTRDGTEHYTYEHDELVQDVEYALWTAAVRTQDFFDKTADARSVHDLIEDFARDFIDQMRIKVGGKLGPYESKLPGEPEDVEV